MPESTCPEFARFPHALPRPAGLARLQTRLRCSCLPTKVWLLASRRFLSLRSPLPAHPHIQPRANHHLLSPIDTTCRAPQPPMPGTSSPRELQPNPRAPRTATAPSMRLMLQLAHTALDSSFSLTTAHLCSPPIIIFRHMAHIFAPRVAPPSLILASVDL